MPFAKSLSELTDRQLAMIPKAERKQLGKVAMTSADAAEKNAEKAEKDLQRKILALLEGHKNICVIWSGMHRKTSTPRGTPDFIFAVEQFEDTYGEMVPAACAWEMKTETGERSEAQIEMERRMTTPPNAWRYRLVRSVQQAVEELRAMGIN